ncbi:MAG: hypothetical protein NTX07_07865 [Solirubrobacterales bacterium]|nr:hypothetical protein [Solirubrobacterales bacterium]
MAFPGSAAAAGPTKPLVLNGSGKSASSHSVTVAANGTETVVWKENQGPYSVPTGNNVMASRITTKVTFKITGSGRRRKKTRITTRTAKSITVYNVGGAFVNEVVSATTSAGVTTVVWGVNDPSGNKVTLMARRIDAKGRLGSLVAVSPAGTRAHELKLATAPNGSATIVWRTDDTEVSWVEAKQLSKSGDLGTLIQVTPSHGAFHNMQAAGRSNGSVDVVWRRNGNGLRPVTQVAQIAADGTVGSPIGLGDPANSSNDDQAIAMSPKGVSSIAWTEYNSTLDKNILRVARVNAGGVKSATLNVASAGNPYMPTVGLAADGTTSIAWTYTSGASTRVRMVRVSPGGRTARTLSMGPAGESLISGFGPKLTVAPSGVTTLAWSVLQMTGFPAPVYLQAIKVDAKGVASKPIRLVTPNKVTPDLVHYPLITTAADGTAVIAFVRRNVFGSASRLNLTTWR